MIEILDSRILRSTFRIEYKGEQATAFTLNYNEKQYLVTAKHAVKGVRETDRIKIFYRDKDNSSITDENLEVKLVGLGDYDRKSNPTGVDIAVLSPKYLLSNEQSIEATSDYLYVSQRVFLVGFPGQYDKNEMAKEYTLFSQHIREITPLVKGGIVSAINIFSYPREILVDAIINRGFSGGPLVYFKHESGGFGAEMRIAGVYTSGRQEKNSPKNAVFAKAHNISHVINEIRGNPVGVPIPPNFSFAVRMRKGLFPNKKTSEKTTEL